MGSVGSSLIECVNELIGVASAATTAMLLTLTLSPSPDNVELKWKVRVRLPSIDGCLIDFRRAENGGFAGFIIDEVAGLRSIS